MTRRLLIAGNWKMHGSVEMATDLISEVSRSVLDAATLGEQRELAYDILVCPPSILIPSAAKAADSQPILLGAQNVHPKEQGAFTGELSIGMLAEFGCQYVLLGHSERRDSLIPILCIGETLSERQSDQTEKVVSAQLDAVLDKVGIDGFKNAVIAYEPVWAIGTGETATPEQAQRVHAFIRTKLAKLDGDIADALRILYGGSMKAENASDLLSQADIDGGLIGGASLKVSSFSAICDAAHTLALNA